MTNIVINLLTCAGKTHLSNPVTAYLHSELAVKRSNGEVKIINNFNQSIDAGANFWNLSYPEGGNSGVTILESM